MREQIKINDRFISYADIGNGVPVVLLHGYLESLEIWNELALALSKKYRVICVDIPGHGKSECISEFHNMEILAKHFNDFLSVLQIDRCILFGHSMGGYLTLMFHKLFHEKLYGFSLFHSHPFADTKETKEKRLREIDLIKEGKKDLIAKFNIPNTFAHQNLKPFENHVNNAINIALNTPEDGIIANLHAMMHRPDLSESLSESRIPFLYILGKNDNYIDYNTIIRKVKFPSNSKLETLENSGHMGFIEEKEKSLNIINQFIQSCIL